MNIPPKYEDVVTQLETALGEVEALTHWRDLALQFDNHRMLAIWHLKALVSGEGSVDCAKSFLGKPPTAAHEVVAELELSKGREAALQTSLDAVTFNLDKTDKVVLALREELAKLGDDYCKRVDNAIALQQRLVDAQITELALREELSGANRRIGACISQIEEQQQRLTVAEQRIDELEGLLREIRQSCELSKLRDAQIDAALKPAEVNSVSCKFDWVKE